MRQLLRSSLFKHISEVLLLAALYHLLGRLGLLLALQHTSISPLWPPMGLALAAVLLRGYRVWPGITLGALSLNLYSFLSLGMPLATASGLAGSMAVGSTLAPLAGARLLQICRARDIRHSTRTLLQFLALTCVIAPVVSATLGVTALNAWGMARWADFPILWLTWWVGDGLGTLVVTPLVLTLAQTRWRHLPVRLLAAGTGMVGLLAVFTAYAFGPTAAALPGAGSGLHYLVIIAALWIAFRFRWPGAVGAATVVVAVASWQTTHGLGPLVGTSPNATLILLDVYLSTLTIATWAMACAVNEQRRAVREISRLSQFNQRVIDNASVWIDVLDTQGNILVWNKAAEAMSGYSHQEVVGHDHIWEWLYPDQSAREELLNRVHKTAMGDEEAVDFETTIRCRDGTLKVVSWYERGLQDQTGQPIGSVALGRDVTRQKEMEQALRQSEANFRALAENASDGIVIAAPPGRLVYANRRAAQITGYAIDQLLQFTFQDVLHPDEYEKVLSRFTARLAGKPVENQYETVLLRSDGSPLQVELTSSATTWQNQLATITAVRDISERKRAEQALRDSEERYRRVMETANDIILLHDMQGRVTYANPAALTVGGYSQEEARELRLWDIVPPDEIPSIQQRIAARSQGVDDVFLYESTFVARDGQHVPVEASSSLVTREGKPAEVLIMGRDMRNRRQMEAERDHLRSQLMEAQKMEAVGQLAGGIAHDFNNLLTAVNGYAELIQFQAQDNTAINSMAGKILTAGERAAVLVRQLLAYARKQRIQPRIVDLNAVVRQGLELVSDRVTDGTQVTTNLQSDLWPLLIDPAQADQLVDGLLCHTCDASPTGGQILVQTGNLSLSEEDAIRHPDAQPGDYVLLDLTHSGASLDESVRQRIFEPFFFNSDAVADGIGLRLAAAYGIVKQNHGHIMVDSPHNNGTRYQVFLPRAPQT